MLNVTDVGQGTAILWIHGFPLSSAIFEPQLAIRGARHVIPDLPGFGQSRAAIGTRTVDDYARIALDLLDHRGIDRAVLAGVSMGGYICMAAARLARERIAGMILIDTRETPDDEKTRQGRYDTIEKVKREGVGPVVESMLPKMVTDSAPQELKDRVREIMSSASVEGTIAALDALATRPDSTATLRTLTVPALVVVGEDDPITPPADAVRMASLIPHARLVQLPNAAHLANMQQAEAFNKEVTVWLGRV